MVHLPGQAMSRKRAAAKECAAGHAREIGSAVDLGITVSIYGPQARFAPASSANEIAQDASSVRLSGPDTWTTEH
jgi:hypothetical protein